MAAVDLFGTRPRRPRRTILKVIDAGHMCSIEGSSWARLQCRKCGHECEYSGTVTEIKNQACPTCSPSEGEK